MFNFRKSKKVFDGDKDITITDIYRPINTREEKEEEIKKRLKALDELSFLGAESIREKIDLQNQLKALDFESKYSEWFNKNKKQLEELFKSLEQQFVGVGAKIYELRYNKSGDGLLFRDYVFNREYLITLLTRYNYILQDMTYWDRDVKKSKLVIKYEN